MCSSPPSPPYPVLQAHFAQMGHLLHFVPDVKKSPNGPWVLDRPHAGLQDEAFPTLELLWEWWLSEAVWIINTDAEYQLLKRWYRTATSGERAELDSWADPGAHDDSTLRPFRRYDRFLGRSAIGINHLPDDWPDVVRDIEARRVHPSERSRSRVLRPGV